MHTLRSLDQLTAEFILLDHCPKPIWLTFNNNPHSFAARSQVSTYRFYKFPYHILSQIVRDFNLISLFGVHGDFSSFCLPWTPVRRTGLNSYLVRSKFSIISTVAYRQTAAKFAEGLTGLNPNFCNPTSGALFYIGPPIFVQPLLCFILIKM